MESEAKGAPKVPDKMNTTRNKLPVLLTGFFAFASSAMSAEQTLPTPPPSEFADTESAAVAVLPDRRKFSVAVDWLPTPSNCVQVAFGQDRNRDEDLEPEETDLVVGCDCGRWFMRDERTQVEQFDDVGPKTNHVFAMVQSRDRGERWNLAKVTTRGRGVVATNATLIVEWKDPFVLFVK